MDIQRRHTPIFLEAFRSSDPSLEWEIRIEKALNTVFANNSEPVAWKYEWNQFGVWVSRVSLSRMVEDDDVRNIVPLYAPLAY